MGINNRHVFSLAMAVAMVVIGVSAPLPGHARQLRPDHRACAPALCVRGCDYRRPRQFWGTLAGGIIIGVAQTVGGSINPEWQILTGHLAFLAVLVLRPRGVSFPRGRLESS